MSGFESLGEKAEGRRFRTPALKHLAELAPRREVDQELALRDPPPKGASFRPIEQRRCLCELLWKPAKPSTGKGDRQALAPRVRATFPAICPSLSATENANRSATKRERSMPSE